MSRVGNKPILIPQNVTVEQTGSLLMVTGPKGKLELNLLPEISVGQTDSQLIVKRKDDQKFSKAAHGLSRSLLSNMVTGCSQGWEKKLEMVGVGYRAQGGGNTLSLSIGFSHPVAISAPEGINFTVTDNTKITVSGTDKALVGQIAANIKSVKPPEVYKGKGIRYQGEYVKRKAGKAAKAAGGK